MPPLPVRTNSRLLAVDGLRGLAVMLVLVHHFVELQLPLAIGSWQAYLALALGLSFTGVDLFFVLSGFLIGGILMDNRNASNFYQVFYVRRTLRIFPLYYAFILACVLLTGSGSGVSAPTYPLGSYLTFLDNFWMAAGNAWDLSFLALAWSLAVEEQFYLVFPLLVRACSPRALLWLTASALVIAPALRLGILLEAPQFALGTHILTFCRMDSLACGVLAAFTVRHAGICTWLSAHARVPGFAVLALMPALGYLTLTRAAVRSLPMAAFGYTVIAIFYTALLLAVLEGRTRWLAKILEWRLFVFTGGISYFIYLFQGLAGLAVFRLFGRAGIALATPADLGLLGLTLLVLASAGWLSWILFESKLISWGRKFHYATEPAPVERPAFSTR